MKVLFEGLHSNNKMLAQNKLHQRRMAGKVTYIQIVASSLAVAGNNESTSGTQIAGKFIFFLPRKLAALT